MYIKDWERFQHYKNRKPPWIRLYRDLLDDPEFFGLTGDQVKTLVLLWLIASEDPEMHGVLPNLNNLSFRLRVEKPELANVIEGLKHFVIFKPVELQFVDIPDDSNTLASRLQHARPDQIRGRSETEEETDQIPPLSPQGEPTSLSDHKDQRDRQINNQKKHGHSKQNIEIEFDVWWPHYPKKRNRPTALKAYTVARKTSTNGKGMPPVERLIEITKRQAMSYDWTKNGGEFVPYPASYIRASGWDNEYQMTPPATPPTQPTQIKLTAAEQQDQRSREALRRFREMGEE